MYIRNGSTVFGCLLDCSKAFDTIQQSLLFKKMIAAKIPLIVIRLFINMYERQTLNVRWKGKFSKKFPMGNGTKQGAVLSPILFCFYMNDLLKELRNSRSGCFIGSYYSGCFGYADDLLFLCPSRSGLQDKLNMGGKHMKTMLNSRYTKFIQSI